MLFNFFKKRPIQFLGRSGLIFKYSGKSYFVDSEMSFTKDVDIVIFKNTIELKDAQGETSETIKNEVLNNLLNYLELEEKLRVKIH